MNKGIYLKTADIYLRFPEIMEEECNDLAEFLEDEHIVYEGATDIIYDLQQENQKLKKQYCERTDCSGRLGNSKKVDQLEKENQRLKEIEKEHQKMNGELRVENKELKKQLENCFCNRTDCAGRIKGSKTYYSLEQKIENQQKEFIEYMNETIEELECDDVDDEEMKGYLIQRIDTFEEILQKYKSIIGGKE